MGKLLNALSRVGVTLGGGGGAPVSTTFMPSMQEFITPFQFAAGATGGKVWGDGRNLGNTSVTAGSNVVTNSVDQPFATTDVGAMIWLINAGPSSGILATTIIERVSASQVKIAVNATTTQTNGRCVVGHDDTTALTLALAAITPGGGRSGKALYLGNSAFITGPLDHPNWASIYAASRHQGGLFLKPGSATVKKYLLKNANLTDARQSVTDMFLCTLRDFQRTGSGIPGDILPLQFAGGSGNTDVVDVKNEYKNLVITEGCGPGLKYAGKGGTSFSGLEISGGNYGFDLDAYDCNIQDCHIQGFATGIKLRSAVGSCRFSNVKAFYSGYVFAGEYGAGEAACWSLNGCFGNNFSACEGQESHGSVMVLANVKRCTFDGFRLADPGCAVLAPGHGISVGGDITAAPSVRAGVQILDGCQNNVLNFSIGARVHGTTNYGTHAVAIDGANTNGNSGRITTDLDLAYYAGGGSGGWGSAKVGKNVSGEGAPGTNTNLLVDGAAI